MDHAVQVLISMQNQCEDAACRLSGVRVGYSMNVIAYAAYSPCVCV